MPSFSLLDRFTESVSGTHRTLSRWRLFAPWGSAIFGQCIEKQQSWTIGELTHVSFASILQTLVTLSLHSTKVGSEGTRYLGEALMINRVNSQNNYRRISSSLFVAFPTDNHDTHHQWKWCWYRRNEILVWSFENNPVRWSLFRCHKLWIRPFFCHRQSAK